MGEAGVGPAAGRVRGANRPGRGTRRDARRSAGRGGGRSGGPRPPGSGRKPPTRGREGWYAGGRSRAPVHPPVHPPVHDDPGRDDPGGRVGAGASPSAPGATPAECRARERGARGSAKRIERAMTNGRQRMDDDQRTMQWGRRGGRQARSARPAREAGVVAGASPAGRFRPLGSWRTGSSRPASPPVADRSARAGPHPTVRDHPGRADRNRRSPLGAWRAATGGAPRPGAGCPGAGEADRTGDDERATTNGRRPTDDEVGPARRATGAGGPRPGRPRSPRTRVRSAGSGRPVPAARVAADRFEQAGVPDDRRPDGPGASVRVGSDPGARPVAPRNGRSATGFGRRRSRRRRDWGRKGVEEEGGEEGQPSPPGPVSGP